MQGVQWVCGLVAFEMAATRSMMIHSQMLSSNQLLSRKLAIKWETRSAISWQSDSIKLATTCNLLHAICCIGHTQKIKETPYTRSPAWTSQICNRNWQLLLSESDCSQFKWSRDYLHTGCLPKGVIYNHLSINSHLNYFLVDRCKKFQCNHQATIDFSYS